MALPQLIPLPPLDPVPNRHQSHQGLDHTHHRSHISDLARIMKTVLYQVQDLHDTSFGSDQTGSMGQGQLYEVQKGQMPGPVL